MIRIKRALPPISHKHSFSKRVVIDCNYLAGKQNFAVKRCSASRKHKDELLNRLKSLTCPSRGRANEPPKLSRLLKAHPLKLFSHPVRLGSHSRDVNRPFPQAFPD